MDRVGLVGLPNSGKSSLFNSLTGGDAVVASHPFSTVETEVGVAHVPDPRVDALGRMSQSRKIVYAGFEVVDIAAIAKGGEKGDALGGRFLAGVREVDALCLVLRSFEDENVPGDTDPLAALEVVELELALADLATLEQQLSKKRSRVAPLDPGRAAGRAGRDRGTRAGNALVPFESACRRSRGVEAVLPADRQADDGRDQCGRG